MLFKKFLNSITPPIEAIIKVANDTNKDKLNAYTADMLKSPSKYMNIPSLTPSPDIVIGIINTRLASALTHNKSIKLKLISNELAK